MWLRVRIVSLTAIAVIAAGTRPSAAPSRPRSGAGNAYPTETAAGPLRRRPTPKYHPYGW